MSEDTRHRDRATSELHKILDVLDDHHEHLAAALVAQAIAALSDVRPHQLV
ncbi:hypothetical protein [Sphingomonas sp. UV9]|uniref:hypothetical protein n=1 Tax=Sphingomonas sp. UV9 TaxID=1851410 RepID=UPI0013E8D355|nr:hypothetical protein [Sphingomonas sp. UV9]